MYVDTSVLVTALTGELHALAVQRWLSDEPVLFVSWWTRTEFAAALARKQRDGVLNQANVKRIAEVMRQMMAFDLTVLPVEAVHFGRAAAIVAAPGSVLRSSDALHLAIAAESGVQLATLDKRMASGGGVAGVATMLLKPGELPVGD